MRIKPVITITITSLILCIVNFPAVAGQVWEGTGRIIRGTGQGGVVQLRLEIKDKTVTFLSGPSRDRTLKISTTSSTVGEILNGNTDIGTWEIINHRNELIVTLYQDNPYRVTRYYLSLDNQNERMERLVIFSYPLRRRVEFSF